MNGYINGYDFENLKVQKYWQHPASQRDRAKEEIRNMIFSGEYIGSRKVDGAYYLFLKDEDGNMSLRGRSESVNGGYLNKIGHVPQLHDFFNQLPNGTCLCGELYFPNNEGSRKTTTIMGCLEEKAVSRQERGEKLHYYIFDILAFNGKNLINSNCEIRIDYLNTIANKLQFECVDCAKYYVGAELWEKLGEYLAAGYEGIVMTKLHTPYQPGKRVARQTLKVKKEIAQTIDCFFTGHGTEPTKVYKGKELTTWKYWVNNTTDERLPLEERYFDFDRGANITPVTKPYYYKWMGSLEIGVVKGDKVVPIGFLSGLPDEIKSNPLAYKGRVIEVSAMQIEPDTKALRHAKMLGFREDKTWKECEWSQLE